MAYTSINKPSNYFNTVTYTGTNSNQSITGVGFQPDLVWIKSRNTTYLHRLVDVVRGRTEVLFSDSTAATQTDSYGTVGSFDSDGVSFVQGTTNSSYAGTNDSYNFVMWNWKAGGTASSNTDGSITSSVSVNTTAGFSIVSYSGNSSSATVGHGLGVAPKFIIIKHRNDADDWTCYHASLGSSQRIQLNNTGAASALSWGGDPTSSVFYLLGGGATAVNVTGGTYIAYCFAEKKGFSKFGSYTGNNNANGTFVYTGFKPAWILVKAHNSASQYWTMLDNKRNSYNQMNLGLSPNSNYSESDLTTNRGAPLCDFVSNGFKWRTDNSGVQGTNSFIYAAFAESPLVTSTGIPTTAR